jgi:hypothetical protein
MNNSKDQFIQDLTNGSNYKPKDNQISLILFVDAVTYVKSVNRSMWAIFSCIAELPPSLRHSSENIIFHSIWSGAGIDFNLFLEVYNKAIDEIVNEGIFFEGKHINVQILGIIADSPARSKICNTIQFNGKFGCNFCLHPTARNTNNTGQIYPLMENIKLRTNKRYKRHLKKAIEQLVYKGIKGATYLTKWILMPNEILLDYMHLCLIGSFKSIISNLFDSKYKNKDLGFGSFYLGKYFDYF